MSQPQRPDSRVFVSYPMPPKIDYSNEQPRRESLLASQLDQKIVTHMHESQAIGQQMMNSQQPIITVNQQSSIMSPNQSRQTTEITTRTTTTTTTNGLKAAPSVSQTQASPSPNSAILARELAQKEAKLMADIQAFHARPYSPYQSPPKIDLASEQTAILTQAQNSPSPRPFSQASSSGSLNIEADLLDKEAKLMKDIEEIERKPFNPQKMVLEREDWYEYPEGRPNERHLTESRRRVRDFCTLPEGMYNNQQAHFHDEQIRGHSAGPSPESIHTAIIRKPKREIDNKSPLPFAFDNLTTKGVRGNIASVGAVEPDRPRAPIYPIVRRTPTPTFARG